MSDQVAVNNQAHPPKGLPLVLGGGCALAGAFINPLTPVKSDFKGAEKLVQLDKDIFETMVKDKDSLSDAGKTALEKLETARTEYADGEKNFTKYLDDNADKVGVAAETNYKPEGGEKTISLLEKDVADAKNTVKVEENEAVKAAQKELDELAKDATDEVKNAATKKVEDAKELARKNDEAVKKAQELVDKAKAERYKKIETKIAESSDETLKKGLTDAKDFMKKINEGTLKDFNWKDLKKILPKAKGLGALIYGAIGLVVGSIIARAVANGKNQA